MSKSFSSQSFFLCGSRFCNIVQFSLLVLSIRRINPLLRKMLSPVINHMHAKLLPELLRNDSRFLICLVGTPDFYRAHSEPLLKLKCINLICRRELQIGTKEHNFVFLTTMRLRFDGCRFQRRILKIAEKSSQNSKLRQSGANPLLPTSDRLLSGVTFQRNFCFCHC